MLSECKTLNLASKQGLASGNHALNRVILIERLATVKLFLEAETKLGRAYRISEHTRKPKSVKLAQTVDNDPFDRRTV